MADANDKAPLKRVQLDMPPKAFERLVKLKVDTEAATYADVVRSALGLYAAVVEILDNDGKILVEDKAGRVGPAYFISK